MVVQEAQEAEEIMVEHLEEQAHLDKGIMVEQQEHLLFQVAVAEEAQVKQVLLHQTHRVQEAQEEAASNLLYQDQLHFMQVEAEEQVTVVEHQEAQEVVAQEEMLQQEVMVIQIQAEAQVAQQVLGMVMADLV